MAKDTSTKLRNQVIYQIFTRNYKDGTFKSVENDLDRIKSLGVDYIYLLPVQPSGKVNRKGSMGSPYAIKDYRGIDPVQGTMEDFISLSNAIHEAGMKLMIDVVYNHTSPDSVLAKEHPEWFYKKDDGNFGNRVGDWWDVIDLDYNNKDLWDYQIDTLKMWAKYVDGFRCDVAPMIPLDFWLLARSEVSKVNPECVWLSESIEYSFIEYLRKNNITALSDSEIYQAFDICYDYDVYPYMKNAITGDGCLNQYLSKVNTQEVIYPDNYCKLRCLENHDRPRAAAMIPNDNVLLNWMAWNYFQKGIVMLYAGEEFCVTHHPTLFDLDTVDFNTGKDISSFVKSLSDIKRDSIFTNSFFNSKVVGNDIILATYEAYKDSACNHKKAIGIFSTTSVSKAVSVPLEDGTYKNAINGEDVDVYEGILSYRGYPIIILV